MVCDGLRWAISAYLAGLSPGALSFLISLDWQLASIKNNDRLHSRLQQKLHSAHTERDVPASV